MTELVLLVLSPITTTEPTEQADKQIAASAPRHQSYPPGLVCKTGFCACDPFPFLPHSAQHSSIAELPDKAESGLKLTLSSTVKPQEDPN